jgi:hypothetical protein
MGRKLGSKNKKHKAIEKGKHKGKKWKVWKKKEYKETVRAKYLREELEKHPPTNARVFKFLGYCNKCGAMVGEGDREEGKKGIVICSCGNRCSVGKLVGEDKKERVIKSKREFLEEGQDILESMPKIAEEAVVPDEINKMDIDD